MMMAYNKMNHLPTQSTGYPPLDRQVVLPLTTQYLFRTVKPLRVSGLVYVSQAHPVRKVLLSAKRHDSHHIDSLQELRWLAYRAILRGLVSRTIVQVRV